jgi:carboxyl-terminal processing protease
VAKYRGSIETALASEILTRYDTNPFRPNDFLTRREFVEWIYRAINITNKKSQLTIKGLENNKKGSLGIKLENGKVKNPRKKLSITILPNDFSGSYSQKSRIPNEHIFRAVFSEIINKYKFKENIAGDKLKKVIDGAIAGMVDSLGDKYSSYIPPANSNDFNSGLTGKFQGIGAYVEMIGKDFTITSPIKGSPAEKAGIMAGDIVLKIDGTSILGLNQNEIVKKIRGPRNTKVILNIRRSRTILDVEIIRGKITVPSLTLKWKSRIPVIGIHQFSGETADKLKIMLKNEILPKNVRGIIFDFRNNPGGFLTTASKMGSIFRKKGETIFYTEDLKKLSNYQVNKDGLLSDFPGKIVVLQNKGTASASEIIIGMLQDYGQADKVIGTVSHGKGTVQEVLRLSNGASLKLTIAKWLTPKKRWIHKKGLIPDIEIPNPTKEENSRKIDKQLNKALEVVFS